MSEQNDESLNQASQEQQQLNMSQSQIYGDQILELFDSIKQATEEMVQYVAALKEKIQVEEFEGNQQIESILFETLNITLSLPYTQEQFPGEMGTKSCLQYALDKLAQCFSYRCTFPYQKDQIWQVLNNNNFIRVRFLPAVWKGFESVVLILITDILRGLKEDFKAVYEQEILIDKADPSVPLQLGNVWSDPNSIEMDGDYIKVDFLVMGPAEQAALAQMNKSQQEMQNIPEEEEVQEEEKPWYGTKRYDVVDKVMQMQQEAELKLQRSPVQEASLKAQQPFMTQSIRSVENYTGPPKYLGQKDAILEIPIEVVKNLLTALDQDLDDRVSIEELNNYIKKCYLPFDEDTVVEMFKEASKGRGIVHEHQREAPLTLDEISASVRGRQRWNPRSRCWEVHYKPMRDHWIVLLQTVNPRLFAMPIPRVIPTKIVAQFEEEDLRKSMSMSPQKKKEGVDLKYMSIKDKKCRPFEKDEDKKEGNVHPDLGSTVSYRGKKQKAKPQNPYEHQVNARFKQGEFTENGFPKVTFESKEFFNQAYQLSQQIPYWHSDQENPIYQYVPTSERPFKTSAEEQASTHSSGDWQGASLRETRLRELANKERTLMLAGTMALKQAKSTPQEIIRERKGFLTVFKIPSIYDQKTDAAFTQKNEFQKKKGQTVAKPIQDEYIPPSDHRFRDLEIPKGQKDFTLRYKCPSAYNPENVSEHDTRPKFVIEKQEREAEREKRRKEEEQRLTYGDKGSKKDWVSYHKLPDQLTPIAQKMGDKYAKGQKKEENLFLDKEEYQSAYLQLARQMKDDVVFGKPNFNLYFKSLNPQDLNEEFGSVKTKPYKCIY